MLYAKKIIVLVICIFSVQLLSAQNNYVTHTLKPGESLSALAKQYNTSVGDIMRVNGMHADTKLVYGSQIKIPSAKGEAKKETGYVVNTHPATVQVNEITHVVAKGETLYSISKKYNVSVDELKEWNHLADNSAKMGTLLIISSKGNDKIASVPVQKQRVGAVAATDDKTDVTANAVTTPEVKTERPQTPVAETENQNDQKQAETIQNNVVAAPVQDKQINTAYTGVGFFQDQFVEKNKSHSQTISGISKTFKTASGWSDGKYYILVNDIQPGTIVKITADNGNAVYAKVLWNMGDLKENSGINFRVSNATAAALHEDASGFNINVSF